VADGTQSSRYNNHDARQRPAVLGRESSPGDEKEYPRCYVYEYTDMNDFRRP
jgi:hypothetical protein